MARVVTRTLLHVRILIDEELHQKRSMQAKTRNHGAKDLRVKTVFEESNLKDR
jgi:hypothetical protein